VSKRDCRDTEDVSVLLLLSPCKFDRALTWAPGGVADGVAFPVMSKFLNEFTSIGGLLLLLGPGASAVPG
jgi:hypothetical protein